MNIDSPYVKGYRRAARHLMAAGLPCAPFKAELQALWRDGGRADHVLLQQISRRWELPW